MYFVFFTDLKLEAFNYNNRWILLYDRI